MWIFEPHIVEAVFDDFVRDHENTVLRDEWLNRKDGVTVDDNRVVSIEALSGKTFAWEMFIDATTKAT
jgi:hypothetical protein